MRLKDISEVVDGQEELRSASFLNGRSAVTLATRRGFAARLVEPTATAGRNDAVARQVLRMIAGACASAGVSEDALGAVGIA